MGLLQDNSFTMKHEDITLRIPEPEAYVLQKILVSRKRTNKDKREKDLDDLIHILENYWEFVEDEAYEQHLDLFDDDFDMQKAAARILGRQLRKTLDKSTYLKESVLRIIKEDISSASSGAMTKRFSLKTGLPLDKVEIILNEILQGIRDLE